MQTEQETSIQQCKENNKKLVKLNVQNILNQNSFDRDINFFDSENYFIQLLQQLNDFLISAINSEKIGYSLIGFHMNYFPIIPSFLLTVIDYIDISDPFFRYLLFYIIDSIKSKDNTLSQANVKNISNIESSTISIKFMNTYTYRCTFE